MKIPQYLGDLNLRIDLTRLGFEVVLYLPDKDFNEDCWAVFVSLGVVHLSYYYYFKDSKRRKKYAA